MLHCWNIDHLPLLSQTLELIFAGKILLEIVTIIYGLVMLYV